MAVKQIWSILFILVWVTVACNLGFDNNLFSNATTIEVVANPSLTPWLQGAIERFHEADIKTSAEKPIQVVLVPVEVGQFISHAGTDGSQPALWLPDNEVWVNVLAEQGQTAFQADCVSVAASPLVIAMWRPIAEALGWPGRSLGWLDIGSLAADPSAWAYYSGGQFGPQFRLGHTHPGLAGSGASTLLAIVQAAEAKTDRVTVTDIQQPIVQASVSAFEGTVSWFSPSADRLGQTMRERGATYLSAAVMYESSVIAYGSDEPGIVPIYPFEGTFMATHPACVNGSLPAESQEAAVLFRDYLLGQEAQQLAVANGLRPVNQEVQVGPPLDAAHGVDLAQPEIIFNQPTVETLYAAQELWQMARKDINLVMLLDTSGSMSGDKIESVREAAIQFVQQMGNDDKLTLISFSDRPYILVQSQPVGQVREQVTNRIAGLHATGDTALYDAIGIGASIIAGSTSSQTSNALIVLSDGQDTSSYQFRFDQQLIETAAANDTTVFTIAYGSDADEDVLSTLAQQANGNFYLGNEINIADIYQEMSAAFGGSVGIGR